MNTNVYFDSGIAPTKEVNWNQSIVELNKLWHSGQPECNGAYIVLFKHAYWFADYDCEQKMFTILMEKGKLAFENEVDKWCLFKKF